MENRRVYSYRARGLLRADLGMAVAETQVSERARIAANESKALWVALDALPHLGLAASWAIQSCGPRSFAREAFIHVGRALLDARERAEKAEKANLRLIAERDEARESLPRALEMVRVLSEAMTKATRLHGAIWPALMVSTANDYRKETWRKAMGLSVEEQATLIQMINAVDDARAALRRVEAMVAPEREA